MPLVFHPNSLPEECEDEGGEKLKKNTNEMDLTALLLKKRIQIIRHLFRPVSVGSFEPR